MDTVYGTVYGIRMMTIIPTCMGDWGVDCDREGGSVVTFLKTWKACLTTSYNPYFFVPPNAFATFRSGSWWSTKGCRVNLANSTHTICYCYHLTSFSVLMQYSPETYILKVNKFVIFSPFKLSLIYSVIEFIWYYQDDHEAQSFLFFFSFVLSYFRRNPMRLPWAW